jgi:hypothetical protein
MQRLCASRQASPLRLRSGRAQAGTAEAAVPTWAVVIMRKGYALLGIWAMDSSMPRFISSADRSAVCVAIDHLWPKGSLSLP